MVLKEIDTLTTFLHSIPPALSGMQRSPFHSLLSLEDREFHPMGVKKKNPLLENASVIKARRSSSNSRLNSIINTNNSGNRDVGDQTIDFSTIHFDNELNLCLSFNQSERPID